ncbi:MAG: penicillin-binding protein 2 [Actinomycetota bacterium]|nr:penicillin-binding protein 2 [Actinomycetota bacterium]
MKEKINRERRVATVVVVFFLCLAVVCIRLVIIQGIEARRYKQIADKQRFSLLTVTPRRGTIFDREGEILAISEDVTTIYATPYQVKNASSAAKKIARVLGEDESDVQKKLNSKKGFCYIAKKVDNRVAQKIKKMKIEGIGFISESKRFYPMGKVASQILGVVDTDNKGQTGLELYHESLLGGRQGQIAIEKDASGLPIPGSEKVKTYPSDGTDVTLTIDSEIQSYLEKSLESAVEEYNAKASTGFVMDCNTGDILAMASYPTFDPNERDTLELSAMRNRAITDVFEPGSCLKVLTAAAALEEKVVTPGTIIHVPKELRIYDKIFKDAVPVGARDLPFTEVISQSSNVGTIEVSQKIGSERLYRYLNLFGLGHKTGVDYPGEVRGIVPACDDWSGTSIATIGIGQGVSVTALQLGCVLGAVANGGEKVYPHFLKARIKGSHMEDCGLGGLGEEIISEKTAQELKLILEKVVEPGGTGTKARIKFYRVGGKTGTAEKPNVGAPGYSGTYMATFAGFAPVENPRLVTVIVLDEPCPIWGGSTAAPVFSEVMGFSLQHLNIPPSQNAVPVQEEGKGSLD